MDRLMEDVFGDNSRIRHCPIVGVWDDLCKVRAEECLSKGKDMDGVFLLSETHAVYLRHKAETNFNHMSRSSPGKDQCVDLKNNRVERLTPVTMRSLIGINTQFSTARGEGIIKRLKDLPQEWTIVQVTSGFDLQFSINPERYRYTCPPTLHINRMECGPSPTVLHSTVDLFPGTSVPSSQLFIPWSSRPTKSFLEELRDLISEDAKLLRDGLKYKPREYWLKRDEHGQRMKDLLNSIENHWLRGWKCFFLGKLFNPEDETKLEATVDSVLSQLVHIDFSARTRSYLSLLVGTMPNLQPAEVHRILRDVLPDSPRQEIFDIMNALEDKRETFSMMKPCKWKRHPVILVLDKRIEEIPWEILPTLRGHPYSRVPSLHFVHSFSVESCNKKEACVDTSQGYYVVNPDGSLPKTEKRMVEYLERRPEVWRGTRGMKVSREEILLAMKKHGVLLYSGHGSGSKYFEPQSEPIHAAMLLMGCGSVSSRRLAAHLDPWGTVHLNILNRSPSVVGMLWSVTDGECDAVTMRLLDVWLGPAQSRKDPNAKMEDGKSEKLIKFSSRLERGKGSIEEQETIAPEELLNIQGDLLRAWAEARYAASQFMTSAAMVAYGVPVRASRAENVASLSSKLGKISLK